MSGGVRIGSNIASMQAIRRLGETSSALSATFERLSSGQRINRAADDAAGLSVSSKLRTDSRVFAQGIRNVNDGVSLLNIADGSISNLTDIVIRLRELAAQGASGTFSNKQRRALDNEAQALGDEYNRIARSTSFNGRTLFDSDFGPLTLQTGNSQLTVSLGGAIGVGTFAAATSVTVGSAPNDIVVADFNGDGNSDVVSANSAAGSISVLLGRSDGTFSSQRTFATGAGPRSLAVGDFDGDGVVDIATSNGRVLRGQGDGTFSSFGTFSALSEVYGTPDSLTAVDMNGDGLTDLVQVGDILPGKMQILLSRGDGTFTRSTSLSYGLSSSSVSTADFNGDGLSDVISGEADDGTFSIFLGRGDGTVGPQITAAASAGNFLQSLTVGDVNSDGLADVVGAGDYLNVLIGRGDGTFAPVVSYESAINISSVKLGDFNGDGTLDVVTADDLNNSLSVYIGRGNGTFNTRQSYSVPNSPKAVAIGDFNADGVSDFVTTNASGASISVLTGSSKEGIGALTPFSIATRQEAKDTMTYVTGVLDRLVAQRGKIGAAQSRAQVVVSTLAAGRLGAIEAESRISSTDVAADSAELTRLTILQQTATSILAQANVQPELALSLLS